MRYVGVTAYAYERNKRSAHDDSNVFYRGVR
ncbi:hypothetical protein BH160DRAFT_0008 [Burkholderia sp. H160]|nr:hypothetical protein BH160DRAFT_0008 [Burkholderia sp. H160]